MAISFPASPTVGQQSTQNGRTYAWTGAAWEFAPEGVYAIGNSGNAVTLSLANGTFQTSTLTPTTACTFTMPALSAGKSFKLILNGSNTINPKTAIFTGVKWPYGVAPVQTAGAGAGFFPYTAYDVYTFISDGTYWYGSVIQDYHSDTSQSKPVLEGYYETGTWTPAYTAPTQPTISYDTTNTTGTWTRIGQLIHATGRIRAASKSGGVGQLRVVGLPFTVGNGAPNYGAVSIGYRDGWLTYAPTTGYLEPSTFGFVLLNFPAGAAAQVGITAAYMPTVSGSDIIFSATYHKA